MMRYILPPPPPPIPVPPPDLRCGDCALWGSDKQDDERVDGLKHCPRWRCWTNKGMGPIDGCFVKKEEKCTI